MPKLKLVKNQGIDDWYTIERAEHDNKMGFVATEIDGMRCMSLTYSGRISDADVEGPASEMLKIAEAIEKRGRIEFRRCAVRVTNTQIEPHWRAKFWSPRNSRRMGEVTLAEADELAKQIRAELGPTSRPASFPIGAKVLIDGQVAARVTGHFPEGSSSYLFPHYKLDIEDGDRNVAVSVTRVGVGRG